MTEPTVKGPPAERSSRSQFIVAFVAATAIGLAGGYVVLRPSLERSTSMAGQARAQRTAVESLHRHSEASAKQGRISNTEIDPVVRETEALASIASRLWPTSEPRPTPELAAARLKVHENLLLTLTKKACDGTPDELTARVLAAALQESDRLAGEGVSFPAIEIALEEQASRAEVADVSVRLLMRALRMQQGGSPAVVPATSRTLSESVKERARSRLMFAAHMAVDEERAFRAGNMAGSISQRAVALAVAGDWAGAEPLHREAWQLVTSAPDGTHSNFAVASVGGELVRFLVSQGKAQEAFEIASAIEDTLRERREPRDSKAYIRSQALLASVLMKLDRPVDADWIREDLEQRLEVERRVEARANGPGIGGALAEMGAFGHAEELYWKEVVCAWRAHRERQAVQAVRAMVQMADRSPEAAESMREVLPTYRRWLVQMAAADHAER